MSRKKLIFLLLLVFAVGIAIGCGGEFLLIKSGLSSDPDSFTATVVDRAGNVLTDEEGNEIDIDDTIREGIVYNVCVIYVRNGEVGSTRDWYGPYNTVKGAIADVEKWLYRYIGNYELYVYEVKKSTGALSFVGKVGYAVTD